jgi:IS6 family transposase
MLNTVKGWLIPRLINTNKAPAYGQRLLCSNAKADARQTEHRQIRYRNNVIKCDHGKLKRIISATAVGIAGVVSGM